MGILCIDRPFCVDHPFKEISVVRNDQDGALEPQDKILQPGHAFIIEMVPRLVKQEQIRLLKNVDLEEDRLKAFINRVEYQYKRGLITREQASSELSDGDFISVKVTQLLRDWDDEIVTQQNLPGTQDLLKWLAAGLDVLVFREYMKLKKYTDSTIDLYVDFQGSRLPSKTDLVNFFDRDTIAEPEFRAGLEALGYLERDIDSFTDIAKQTKERRAEFERRNPGTAVEFPTAGGR